MINGVGASGNNSAQALQMWQNLLAKMDTNGDGSIAKTEVGSADSTKSTSLAEIFSKIDTDQDSYISKSEFETGIASMAPPMPPPPQNSSQSKSSSESSDEQSISSLFSSLDINGDGSLDTSELETFAPRNGPSTDELFGKVDTDGNGLISETEFTTDMAKLDRPMPPPPPPPNMGSNSTTGSSSDSSDTESVSSIFNSLDTNGDGVIDLSELEAAVSAMESQALGSYGDTTSTGATTKSTGVESADTTSSDARKTSSDTALNSVDSSQLLKNSILDMILKAYNASDTSGALGSSSSSLSLLA